MTVKIKFSQNKKFSQKKKDKSRSHKLILRIIYSPNTQLLSRQKKKINLPTCWEKGWISDGVRDGGQGWQCEQQGKLAGAGLSPEEWGQLGQPGNAEPGPTSPKRARRGSLAGTGIIQPKEWVQMELKQR